MSVIEARTQKFLDHVGNIYSIDQTYTPARHLAPLQVNTSSKYSSLRKEAISNYLRSAQTVKEDGTKFVLSEWTTFTCIATVLKSEDQGIITEMASPLLETGIEGRRKGVDLLISKKNDSHEIVPLLGINVKMKKTKINNRTDEQHFDPILCAPSISIALGNWETDTREQANIDIRDWMKYFAVPQIGASGKLPHMNSLREYIFHRIFKTLDSYLWKSQMYPNGEYSPSNDERTRHLFPENWRDYEVFQHKLSTSHALFSDALLKIAAEKNYIPSM